MNKVITDFKTDKFGYVFTCGDGTKIKFSIDYGSQCCDVYGLFLLKHASKEQCDMAGLSAVEMVKPKLSVGKEWFIDGGARHGSFFDDYDRDENEMLVFNDGIDVNNDIIGKKLVSCSWGLDFYSDHFRKWFLPGNVDVWKYEEGSGMKILKNLCDENLANAYEGIATACLNMKFVGDDGNEFVYTLIAFNEHNGYYKHEVEYIFGNIVDQQEI